MSNRPVCDRCAGQLVFRGRISLPPQTIHTCKSCGDVKFISETPARDHPGGTGAQPKAQQQQAQSIKTADGEEPA
jgi:hypothetical protein